jgi:hypothetical protein
MLRFLARSFSAVVISVGVPFLHAAKVKKERSIPAAEPAAEGARELAFTGAEGFGA